MNQVKLSTYIKRNVPYMVRNWKDEYIRLKYNNDIQKYITAKQERIDYLIDCMYIDIDMSIDESKRLIASALISI